MRYQDEDWTCYRHGIGRALTSPQGVIVDFEDISQPSHEFNSWEFWQFVSSMGRTGDKFIRRQVGMHDAGGSERVDAYLEGLVEDGYLQQVGRQFSIAEPGKM